LRIEPPKGILFYGPPLTEKTLCARAVACFIRIIGSELVQNYAGNGSGLVHEINEIDQIKKSYPNFFDEICAVGCAHIGNDDVQSIML
jgi:ATP-dependent 26S proteasome regulatory subunit